MILDDNEHPFSIDNCSFVSRLYFVIQLLYRGEIENGTFSASVSSSEPLSESLIRKNGSPSIHVLAPQNQSSSCLLYLNAIPHVPMPQEYLPPCLRLD